MASVQRRTRRGVVSYRAVWKERGPGSSKPRQRNKTFSKASDAKAFAARMAAEIEARNIGDAQKHSVGKFLTRWLAFLRDADRYSPATLAGYERAVAMASRELGDLSLSRVTAQHLDAAYARLRKCGGRVRNKPGGTRPLTARTVLHVHRCLHTAFQQAWRWKILSENPARDATAPSPRKSKVRAFSIDEVKRLLEVASADPETHAIVCVLLACGLRRSELLGLAFDCVDFDAGNVTVRRAVIEGAGHVAILRERAKTESSLRTISVPAILVELLRQQHARVQENMLAWGREYQRQPLLVFGGLGGRPLPPQSLTDRLKALMRRAKVSGASPVHAWRHTAGTSLFDATRNIKTVQSRLGHSTPAITMHLYVHAVEERDKEAAEHFGKLIER
jgi:integrase